MNPILGAKETIQVGVEVIVETTSTDEKRGVVFEDDGTTGYFYARDFNRPEHYFVDALHIYSKKEVTDGHIPSELNILWSPDETKAVLIINQYPHALFDFTAQIGYSRDEFPEADPKTGWSHKPWSDELRDLIYRKE
jgi:hypothetical protein